MSSSKLNPTRERHGVCAQRLRTRRLALGLSQPDVVARLEQRGCPVTSRGLGAMENGRGLDLGLLPELAAVLDCTVTYLLGLTPDPWAWQPGASGATDRSPIEELEALFPAGPEGVRVLGPGSSGDLGGPGVSTAADRTRWRDPGSGP